jgi:predicted Zn finger-like uncharacterized protein
MLVNCNSCQKKFSVPNEAITKSGRLVQCGSCGEKWTQYPVEDLPVIKKKITKEKTSSKKIKPKLNLYSPEYLQKKHGLIIKEAKNQLNKKMSRIKKKGEFFGFYSYVIILLIFFVTLFGVLNLTKEIIILNFPSSEIYIGYLYESIIIIKTFLNELIN